MCARVGTDRGNLRREMETKKSWNYQLQAKSGSQQQISTIPSFDYNYQNYFRFFFPFLLTSNEIFLFCAFNIAYKFQNSVERGRRDSSPGLQGINANKKSLVRRYYFLKHQLTNVQSVNVYYKGFKAWYTDGYKRARNFYSRLTSFGLGIARPIHNDFVYKQTRVQFISRSKDTFDGCEPKP